MADSRLKIKIGVHEFEAEGPSEMVQAQFEAFKDLVATAPNKPVDPPVVEKPNGGDGATPDESKTSFPELQLDKIMKADGRIVSLTVRAASDDDAVMLMLLGQRQYRANDSVTGGEIKDGLRQSGQPVDRTDRILDKLSTGDAGAVITIGQRKGRRYRLTNKGIAEAQRIARDLIATVP